MLGLCHIHYDHVLNILSYLLFSISLCSMLEKDGLMLSLSLFETFSVIENNSIIWNLAFSLIYSAF